MKRVIPATLVLALALAAGAQAGVRFLQPENAGRVYLTVAGKPRLYFRTDAGASSRVDVTGPGELKLIVRAIPRTPDMTAVAYTIVVSEGKRELKRAAAETVPITTRWTETNEPATQSRSLALVLPEGEHRLDVRFDSKDAVAAGVRYVFRGAGGEHLPIQGSGGTETVVILVKEKPLDYYITDASHPLEVDLIGPTSIRVVSRLVFRDGARGEQNYAVAVERNGKPLMERSVVTTKSDVTECEEHPDWILGKSRTFKVDIPKGKHRVLFRPSKTNSPGVALRLSIPSEDITNEE